MNDNVNPPIDPPAVLDRLRRAVDDLEAAATHVEAVGRERAPPAGDEARAEAAEDLRELHDVVSRRLDTAIARLRSAVRNDPDA